MSFEMQIFLVAIFALAMGSFVSLLSYRLANKQPIIFTRSKCINCGCVLKAINLIPLFSWLCQKGKCSQCHCKISARYPAIELSFLITFLAIFFVLGSEINFKILLYFLIASIFYPQFTAICSGDSCHNSRNSSGRNKCCNHQCQSRFSLCRIWRRSVDIFLFCRRF